MSPPRSRPPVPHWAAAACVGGLLLLSVALWKDVIGWGPGRDELGPLDPKSYEAATVRKVRKDMTFGGAPCSSCHEGTEPLQGDPKERGVFHEAIELKHGRNQHCFNCHHRLKPENFANFDGTQITLASVEQLCARCHGTTYRDWKSGAHGRRSGHWDVAKGGPNATVCIACHDPHWPLFKGFEAAPAPHVNPRTRKRGPRAGEGMEGAPH
ncbi:MAG: hypothetical protein HY549_07535 [Elusimicrobia bacterium]|nr:hypothetical protein [Elusimicrobiota bacterium]